MPSAVVLAIDGLGAKHLGPYGNTWLETPAFNRLATEALLIDGLFSPGPDTSQAYQSLWSPREHSEGDFITSINEKGIHTQLLTDESALWSEQSTSNFAQQDQMEPAQGVRLASEWQDTHTARFFAQAVQALDSVSTNDLLWLHFRGLRNPWDAPYAYRQQFVDEEDPDATGSAQVPNLTLDEDYDPDTLHEIQCAYAGQVSLLDECFAVLLSVIRQIAAGNDLLFLVCGTRGFPLGEHLAVGQPPVHQHLYNEALSVPAFIRYPDGHLGMKRHRYLAQLGDLSDCLSQWLLNHEIKLKWPERQFSVSRGDESWLLRTQSWHAQFDRISDQPEQDLVASRLFLQPDDANEVNDVSDRCEAVASAAREFLLQIRDANPAVSDQSVRVPEILLEPAE